MSVMHTSRILAIFYMQKWNKLWSVVPCSFWNVDTIFLCSRIMKINWQWNQHIRDRSNIFYREISSIVLEKSIHIEEPELLCACGRPADLKTAGVDSNPDCHFFKAHHPVWVFHIEFPFYSRHYIFFPTRYSRHYIEFVSCSFTCLHCSMKCTCPLRSFSPYFSHHADFGSWRFSCWLLGKNVHVLFFYNDFSHLTLDIALVLFTWFSVACCCINCLFGCSRCIILGYGRIIS